MKSNQHYQRHALSLIAVMGVLAMGPSCVNDVDDLGPALGDDDGAAAPVPGADELATTRQVEAFPGFEMSIDIDGDDVVLTWPTSSGTITVLRATAAEDLAQVDLDTLPASVETFTLSSSNSFVDAGAASRTTYTPSYFYRVIIESQGLPEISTMAIKTTTATVPGYNKFGLCMLDGVSTASEVVDQFGDAVVAVYAWNEGTQSWLEWMPAGGGGPFGDFVLDFGGVVAVQFDDTVDAYASLAGIVPSDEPFEISSQTGLNLQTFPVFYDGPANASYWVEEVGYWGVGEWDAVNQDQNWYWGPGDADITMEACQPYYVQLPPEACTADADCSAGQHCDFAPATSCGDYGAGVCEPNKLACPEQDAAVCGCDGMTYANACEASAAGVSVAAEGECAPTCEAFDFEDPGVTAGWQLDGDWGLYTEAPPSFTHDAVPFIGRGNVFGTDGNRTPPYPGNETENSQATIGPVTFGETLSFLSWHVDEGSNPWDRETIEVSTDGGVTFTPIVDCYNGINNDLPFCQYHNSDRAGDDWDEVIIDTAILAGQTGLLRFTYSTLDSCCSFEQGWFIDDLTVGECG